MINRAVARLMRAGLLPTSHDIALLRRDSTDRERAVSAPLSMRQIALDESSLRQAHGQLGHRIAPAVLRRRLHQSLRFVVFEDRRGPVGSAWLVFGGRYIDELAWLFPLAASEVWLRDVFVAPGSRGRRVFASMVATLIHGGGDAISGVWSDVDWNNASSMKAHYAAGFQLFARRRAWHWRSSILRGRPPAWPGAVGEIHAESALLRLKGAVLQRHRSLLA